MSDVVSTADLLDKVKAKDGFNNLTLTELDIVIIKTNEELLNFSEAGLAEVDLTILTTLLTYNQLVDTTLQSINRNAYIILKHRASRPKSENFSFDWFKSYSTGRGLSYPPFSFNNENEPIRGAGIPLIGGMVK